MCTCICVYVHADLRYTKRDDDFFFLVYFGISSSHRLADDERAVGEFQKRSPQYRDAYVSSSTVSFTTVTRCSSCCSAPSALGTAGSWAKTTPQGAWRAVPKRRPSPPRRAASSCRGPGGRGPRRGRQQGRQLPTQPRCGTLSPSTVGKSCAAPSFNISSSANMSG